MNILKTLVAMVTYMGLAQVYGQTVQTVTPERQNEWWLKRHEQKIEEVRKFKDEIDFVFVGDSITHFMDDRAPGLVQRTFPGIKHLNLGYSADKTENVLWRLRNGELDGLEPKLAVVMIGTNNTGHRKDPAQVTAEGIGLIVKELRHKLPRTKVLLLSIFPRGATPADPLRKLNEEINLWLPLLVDNKMVFHLDIGAKFLDGDGNLSKQLMPDLLHPNAAGYEVWMKAMTSEVSQLLSESHTASKIWSLERYPVSTIQQGWGQAQIGHATDGGAMSMGGITYKNGIGTFANSSMKMKLDGRAVSFNAKVGIPDSQKNHPALVEFIVEADGQQVWASGKVSPGQVKPVRVELSGVRSLVLRVTDGGNGLHYDQANWADAEITYTETAPSTD